MSTIQPQSEASSARIHKAHKYATGLALIATLGPLFYGFEGMVLNGAIGAVGTTFQLGPLMQGIAGSAGIIGAIIGAFVAGRISDIIGRKTTLMWVGPLLMFEAICGAFSPQLGPEWGYVFLLLCRIVGGVGFGAATTVAPGYVAEIAPASIRGRLIAFRQLAIIIGLTSAAVINAVIVGISGGSGEELAFGIATWQFMFLFLIIPALCFIGFTARIPESPRYLVAKGRKAEAAQVLERVTGESSESVAATVESIHASLGTAGGETWSIGKILKSEWRGLVFVGIALAAFQQLTGTNGIFFYSNMIFESIGYDESTALYQTLFLGVFKIVGVTAGILLVDRVGRKKMLMVGGALIFVALGIIATIFTFAPHNAEGSVDITSSPVLGYLVIIGFCLFLLGFTSSWGPIFSVLMGEMFPNKIRGGAMSLASGADFVVNLLVVISFPYLVAWSPAGVYWIFFVFGVLAVLFTGRFVKETKGANLEEMEKVVKE
ncbi:MAG: sugar porter family MFS transporter [Actinomycetaceae bacterium]|nr:sugar porter family MFS transporter [Arcanobacterium sp.]MDD7505285.1 sugar porter family MFS transporter [Actinomycetaceae bacterium]MDY6143414.1 sugar porter family MFS transporter [Arcanobacterium sp.]